MRVGLEWLDPLSLEVLESKFCEVEILLQLILPSELLILNLKMFLVRRTRSPESIDVHLRLRSIWDIEAQL